MQPQQFPPQQPPHPYPQQPGFNYGYPPSWGFPNQYPGAYPQNQWVNPNTWQNQGQPPQGASTQQLPIAPSQPAQGPSVGNPPLGASKTLSKNQRRKRLQLKQPTSKKGKRLLKTKTTIFIGM
jgi:hypothetical protein